MKSAVRSSLFLTLMVILLIVTIGLPLSVKGDGTLNGRIALILYYSLGLTKIILGIATVWVSCWAIAWEVEGKYIQTIAVKPVRRAYIWIGKWLGILFVNAVLIAVSAGITYVMTVGVLSMSGADQKDIEIVKDEVLACRIRAEPNREDISKEAHDLADRLKERGEFSEEVPDDEIYLNAYRRVVASKATVSPGQSKEWHFDIRKEFKGSSKVTVRYNLSARARQRNPVSGKWVIGTDVNPEAYVSKINNYLFGRHILNVPVDILDDAEQLIVTFVNSDRDKSNVAIFDVKNEVEMLVVSGGFAGNYFRTVLILFCQLAMLAALGVTAGSLLTFPVASFAVISLLMISLLSHYFSVTYGEDAGHQHQGHDCESAQKTSAHRLTMEQVVVRANVVVAPAMRFQPIDALTDGLVVSREETFEAILVLLLLYPGIFGLFGAWFLSRRELALPVS